MAVVEIHMRHEIEFVEVERPHLPTEPEARCSCGWREKGYGARDLEAKSFDHIRRVDDITIKAGKWQSY